MATAGARFPGVNEPGAVDPGVALPNTAPELSTRSRWTTAFRSPLVTGTGLYTGTVAVPRGADLATYTATPEFQAAERRAALLGAAQRAQRAGLPPSTVPVIADIFQGKGAFPDLSELESGTGFAGVRVDPSTVVAGAAGAPGGAGGAGGAGAGGVAPQQASVLGGFSPTMLLVLMAGAAVVLLVFGKGGKR